jgi:hypothetical protein
VGTHGRASYRHISTAELPPRTNGSSPRLFDLLLARLLLPSHNGSPENSECEREHLKLGDVFLLLCNALPHFHEIRFPIDCQHIQLDRHLALTSQAGVISGRDVLSRTRCEQIQGVDSNQQCHFLQLRISILQSPSTVLDPIASGGICKRDGSELRAVAKSAFPWPPHFSTWSPSSYRATGLPHIMSTVSNLRDTTDELLHVMESIFITRPQSRG